MSAKSWSGMNLRMAYVVIPPYSIPYVDATGRGRLHGFLGSLLGNVTESLNMTYTIVAPTDGAYGHVDVETGELHGAPRLVVDGKADVVVGPMVAQDGFFQQLHELPRVNDAFTKGVFVFGFKDEYITTTQPFTEAVDIDTWLGLLGCASALITLAVLYHGYIYPYRQVPLSLVLTRWSFTFFGILLQEATSSKPPRLWFDRLVRGIWMVGCMLFSYIFLGTLRANLIVLTPTERINTMDVFLTKPEKTIFYGQGTPAEWIIQTYAGPNGDKLREHFRRNQFPVHPFPNIFTVPVMEQMVKAKGCMFFEERAIVKAVSNWCVASPYFFHVMRERVSTIDGTMYLSKTLPKDLIKTFDKKISWLQALAVPFMSEREILGGNLECIAGVDKRTSESVRQVVFEDLQTIHISLLLGLATSIVVFGGELVYYNSKRCYRLRK